MIYGSNGNRLYGRGRKEIVQNVLAMTRVRENWEEKVLFPLSRDVLVLDAWNFVHICLKMNNVEFFPQGERNEKLRISFHWMRMRIIMDINNFLYVTD